MATDLLPSRRDRKKVPLRQRVAEHEELLAATTLAFLELLRVADAELTQLLHHPSGVGEILKAIEASQRRKS